MPMEFTNNWFDITAKELWTRLVPKIDPKTYLEIGSYEGASLTWMAVNINLEEAHCIDTWKGGGDLDPMNMEQVEKRFWRNVTHIRKELLAPPEIHVHDGDSLNMLAKLIINGFFNYFDMIYVDGSHKAPDVLRDACMAWPLLKPGKFMFFDDYLWRGDHFALCPKMAIDAFCNCYSDEGVVIESGRQVVIQKREKL